ncbi:hypothetical protein Tco_0347184 [Tanacetum coccineum]
MSITKEQQQTLDDALVPREQRLTIGSCNCRLSTTFKPKEPTFQVALDVLSLTPFYPAFLITASVPAIYAYDLSKTSWTELHKFSDGTLDDVRTALNDRLKGIRMQYLPHTIWRQRDKENARAMIQAIEKKLKTRRIMRSLEKFVGGRSYEGDFRLLQRTI